jgi:Cu/Ag efflux protein CusF
MKTLTKAGLLVLAATIAAPAVFAQNLNKERGNILAVDWNAMQVRLKDPQGRERTWPVSRTAVVEFNDKREKFPNPKLQDLVPPMYVHFTFHADTKEIVKFEVAEVGFEPGARGGAAPSASTSAAASAAGTQTATITAIDANVGQVEVQTAAGKHTYWVEPKTLLKNYKAGDRVRIQVQQQGDKEVVTAMSKTR